MYQLFQNLTKKQKIATLLILFLILATAFSAILYTTILRPNPYGDEIPITNLDEIPDFTRDQKDAITNILHGAVAANSSEDPSNIKDATIRPDSYTLENDYASFIVDIASINQSYSISLVLHPPADSGDTIWISCLPADQLIYGDFVCYDPSIGGIRTDPDPIEPYIPYSRQSDLGIEFYVYLTGNHILEVDLNTCDALSKDTYKSHFLSWLTSIGLDINDYQVTYVTPCD
jgi:hypothetical protein